MSTHDHDLEFADFFRQNDRRLRGFLKKTLDASPDDIDEVAPFAFLAVRLRWERLRLGYPKAYLFTIGSREVNKRRKRHHGKLVNTVHVDPENTEVADQHNQVDSLIDQLALEELVQQLRPQWRQAVTLRYIYKFTEAETAMIMNVALGTVKRYTFDGRNALEEMLAAREAEVEGGEAGNP